MKTKELIYDIQSHRASYLANDESALSDYQLLYEIDTYRAMLISQKEKRSFDEDLLQTLFVNLEEVPQFSNEFVTCLASPEIPDTIRRAFIGSDDGLIQYSNISTLRLGTSQNRKIVIPRYMIKDKRVYVFNPKNRNLRQIMVKAVFSRPIEVAELNGITNLDFNYPMPLEWVDTIRKLLLQTEFRQIFTDKRNDGNDGLSTDAEGMLNNQRQINIRREN